MIYDAYYQRTDLREACKDSSSLPVQLKPTPGGLLYYEHGSDTPKKLEWDDEDPDAYVDDEPNGVLIVTTAEGPVMFQKIEEPSA